MPVNTARRVALGKKSWDGLTLLSASVGLVISGDESPFLSADGQLCKESQEHMPSLQTTGPEECFHANI